MNQTMTSPESAVAAETAAVENAARAAVQELFAPSDTFVRRHIGPRESEIREMLGLLGYQTLDDLIDATVPPAIRLKRELKLGKERGEHELLQELAGIAKKNKVAKSFIGQGYY